jgi:Putative adhesin
MMQKKLKILWTCLAVFALASATAQTTLQVATKHLEKEFEGVHTVIIDAEKADIEILVWNKSKVQLNMDLSAKHPEKSVAAQDLNFLKSGIDAKNGELRLRNYILLGQKDKKPESNFKAKYVLKIPENSDLQIKNSFGKIYHNGETRKLTITAEFCTITLNHIKGLSKIQTKYGDLNIDGINGTTSIKTERSNLTLKNFSGSFTMETYYGEIQLISPREVQNLTLNGDKSDIQLKQIPTRKYKINLSTSFGEIHIPTEFGTPIKVKNTEQVFYNSAEKSSIKITNKSGNITLEKQ